MELTQMSHEIPYIGGMAEFGPGPNGAECDDARKNMSEWKEQQSGSIVLVEEFGHDIYRRTELEAEVAVGQFASLGSTGRAGRIDQCRHRVTRQCRSALLHLVITDVAAQG